MKHFYLYIIFLSIFIIFVSYINVLYSKEHFSNSSRENKTYTFLGDSILKNDQYVKNGKTVDQYLKEKSGRLIYNYALDNTKIVDIYSQLNKIPLDVDSSYNTVFLSVGGNDILSFYSDQGNDTNNTSQLQPMISAYDKLVKSIQTKMSDSKIVLLDLYYPSNIKYQQYYPVIKEWNKLLKDYASNNQLDLLETSSLLTKEEDFTFSIEPSSTGGEKLADSMMDY